MSEASTCRRRSVPESAFDYARGQAWLARGLKRNLEAALTPVRWKAWTLAEPSVPEARLEQFSQGGGLCPRAALERRMACEVADAMGRARAAVWLLPDPMGKPGDAFLRTVPVPHVVVDDAVYYLERTQDCERLAAAWDWASSAAGQMGLVTEGLQATAPTQADLARAAARATLIVISAYDGEGVLFFEPTERINGVSHRSRGHAR